MSERTDGIPVPSDAEVGARMVAELAQCPALHIHRYVALVPSCFGGYAELLAGIYSMGLDPKLRETVFCRIGAKARCHYELYQHRVLAAANGVTEAEMA